MNLPAEPNIRNERLGPIEDFSLVLGGPLYQLLLRSNLIKPPLGNLGMRIAFMITLAWVPLLILTIVGGGFLGSVNVPFLNDFEVHARLLCALPLLVLAELVVYTRMRAITAQFVERHIVTEHVVPQFNAVIASAMRLRNSMWIEVLLLAVVVIAGPQVWRQTLALRSDTWYATILPTGLIYTPAGRWYAYVSVPVFQFILLRWYYRLAIWCRFLFQVSRLDLNLIAIHPDRCCGLGFLSNVVFSFAPILMAHSALVAGYIANRILKEGSTLPNYRFELLGMAVLLLAMALGPLCVFAPKLNRAKLTGLRIYGTLASEYVVSFAGKWTKSGGATEPRGHGGPLLGSPDIQSLADLGNSYAVVNEVKVVPFGKDTIVRFLVVIAIPLSPLVFTMFSPDELFRRLITIVL